MTVVQEFNRLEDLRQTQSFAWLRERDIDLLLCAELFANTDFQNQLASLSGEGSAIFENAVVSQYDTTGESDLVVLFRSPKGSRIVLVENKIAAEFQQDQGLRYQFRANGWRRQEGVISATTLLICPHDYLARSGAEYFDQTLSYEHLAEELRKTADPRSAFLAERLIEGVESYRRGYVAIPDKATSDIWTACWRISQEATPALNFPMPRARPKTSSFIYFNNAKGFSSEDTKLAKVVYKARHGNADLQFYNRAAGELEGRLTKILDADMKVVQAAKSACVRIEVDPVDFNADPEGEMEKMLAGLIACERLRAFFVDQRLAALMRGAL